MGFRTSVCIIKRKEWLIFRVALIKNYITPGSDPGISKPGEHWNFRGLVGIVLMPLHILYLFVVRVDIVYIL